MSVIAWDGKTLAADRQSTQNNARMSATKIFQVGDNALAFCGVLSDGVEFLEWYKDGADPEEFPEFDSDDWLRVIEVTPKGAFTYEGKPVRVPVEDPFMAWGDGRDFALGAMAMGADAVKAVEIASQYNINCGMGIDSFKVGK